MGEALRVDPDFLKVPARETARVNVPITREVLKDAGLIKTRAWYNPARYTLFNNRFTRFLGRSLGIIGRGTATVKAADTTNTMALGAITAVYAAKVNQDRNAMLNTLAEPGGFDRVDVDAHLKTRFAAGMMRNLPELNAGIDRGPALHDLVLPLIP
jgi:hypothetical protein